MGAWVEVFMVRWMPEVSRSPEVKLLRLSDWLNQIVWGWVVVAARTRRDSWSVASDGKP